MNHSSVAIQEPGDRSISVSVIIPVLDNIDGLRRCLHHLSAQTHPAEQIQIIVIDRGSAETVTPLKSEYPVVKWMHEPNCGRSIACNLGVGQANGAVLAFTEADCQPDHNWIASGLERLGTVGAPDVLNGRVELDFSPPGPRSTLQWYQQVVSITEAERAYSGESGTAANLMVGAETFRAIGNFDGKFEVDGDRYWVQYVTRAGYRVAYAKEVLVRRPARQTAAELFATARQKARETLIQNSKVKSSLVQIVWESLCLFLPEYRQTLRIFQRRGGLPLMRIPGVFCLGWLVRIVTGTERFRVGVGDFLRKLTRLARVWLPYPKIWAVISGNRVPVTCISGRHTGLNRPESVTFSASSQMIGVSNSEGHSVGFYSAMDKSGQAWSATPCGVISNTDCLHYIHDAVLSPCGSYIATVAREAHSMTAFKPPGTADASGDSEPLWCFKGPESGLNFPTGIAIHPSGDFIAVANRIRLGISLYRRSGDKGRFEVKPFQFITEQDGYRFDLSSPHGLDFSPDGKFLVVTHKRFRTWGNAGGGQSGLAVYRWQETPDPHLDSVPVAIERYGDAELHSVSVHPSGDLIGVSDEGMGVDIFRFSAQQGSLSKVATFPLFRIGSSVKGLGFTRDGKQFAVTCDLDEILFFDTPAEAAITPTAAVA